MTIQEGMSRRLEGIKADLDTVLHAIEQEAQALRWRLRNFAANEISEELTVEVADLVVTVGEVAVLSGRFVALVDLENGSDQSRTRCSEANTDSLAGPA